MNIPAASNDSDHDVSVAIIERIRKKLREGPVTTDVAYNRTFYESLPPSINSRFLRRVVDEHFRTKGNLVVSEIDPWAALDAEMGQSREGDRLLQISADERQQLGLADNQIRANPAVVEVQQNLGEGGRVDTAWWKRFQVTVDSQCAAYCVIGLAVADIVVIIACLLHRRKQEFARACLPTLICATILLVANLMPSFAKGETLVGCKVGSFLILLLLSFFFYFQGESEVGLGLAVGLIFNLVQWAIEYFIPHTVRRDKGAYEN
jgi:hypothetical protein